MERKMATNEYREGRLKFLEEVLIESRDPVGRITESDITHALRGIVLYLLEERRELRGDTPEPQQEDGGTQPSNETGDR